MKSLRDRVFLRPDILSAGPSILITDIGSFQNNYLYVLRDDLLPRYFGGNKARKAYFYRHFFITENIDCVMTYGTTQSNHARAIALLAAELGIDSYLICPGEKKQNFNSKLREISKNKVIYCSIDQVKKTIDDQFAILQKKYQKPYFIPGGGHDIYGTYAFVDLMFKIKEWELENQLAFDHIYFASGTGGTQAGLLIGEALLREKFPTGHHLTGISIARNHKIGIQAIREAVDDFCQMNDLTDIKPNINFNTDYILGGYGNYSGHIQSTIEKILVKYQIPLDPTYTGKAFYGMCREIESMRDKKILFIHTGGTPLFYDYLNKGM